MSGGTGVGRSCNDAFVVVGFARIVLGNIIVGVRRDVVRSVIVVVHRYYCIVVSGVGYLGANRIIITDVGTGTGPWETDGFGGGPYTTMVERFDRRNTVGVD